MTILSILSDQPIPSVAFLKHFEDKKCEQVFISSAQYYKTGKHKFIAQAAGILDTDYTKITIDSEKVILIFEQLNKIEWVRDENYIINITGGNKLMSQAVYSFFIQFPNVEVYYLPIGSNYLQMLHPEASEVPLNSNAFLDINTYFASFGYKITSQSDILKKPQLSEQIFKKVVKANSLDAEPLIEKYTFSKKKADENKVYYSGRWLEEHVYNKLKSLLSFENTQIAFGVKLKSNIAFSNSESDQEVDVLIVHNNRVCFVECKVFHGKLIGQKITDPAYKLSAIGSNFGINALKYLIICGKNTEDPQGLQGFRIKDLKTFLKVDNLFTTEDFRKTPNPFDLMCKEILK